MAILLDNAGKPMTWEQVNFANELWHELYDHYVARGYEPLAAGRIASDTLKTVRNAQAVA